MTPIEKAARAMCDRLHGDREIADRAWAVYREDYIKDAIAAIRAIREPTQQIIGTAQSAMRRDDLDPTREEIVVAWYAMIDSILSEEEAKP